MNVLEFHEVGKTYDVGSVLTGNRGTFDALKSISFTIGPGETVGLVGESGSGKSTTARIACGMLPPTRGEVTLLGTRIDGKGEKQLRPLRSELGLVFQDPYASLNPRHRIGDILAMPFQVQRSLDKAKIRAQVLRLLERIGLAPAEEFARKLPHQLSGGQRQRVAIARAIALRPRLLVADEPVSALDVSIAGQILNLLREVQHEIGSSTLFISHDLSLVRAMCDRVLVMNKGEIVESGDTADVLEHPEHPYTQRLLASMPSAMTRADLVAPGDRRE